MDIICFALCIFDSSLYSLLMCNPQGRTREFCSLCGLLSSLSSCNCFFLLPAKQVRSLRSKPQPSLSHVLWARPNNKTSPMEVLA